MQEILYPVILIQFELGYKIIIFVFRIIELMSELKSTWLIGWLSPDSWSHWKQRNLIWNAGDVQFMK